MAEWTGATTVRFESPPLSHGDGFISPKMDGALFLRTERLAGGRRTFRLVEAEPLPMSYGEDLYGQIFGTDRDAATG
jgi:hypothetical protein